MSVLTIPDLEAGFLLNETSGDVARNVVRTTLFAEDFSAAGSSDSFGYLPAGWSRWSLSATAGPNAACSQTADGVRFYLAHDGTGTDYLGAIKSGLIGGRNYVITAEVRVNSIVGGTSDLRFAVVSGVWLTAADSSSPIGEWVTVTINAGAASLPALYMAASTGSAGGHIDVEVRNVTVTEENAGTYDRDASNTHETVSGLGSITDAQAFNGTSDYCVVDGVQGLTGEATISAWVKSGTSPAVDYRVACSRDGSGNGIDLYIEAAAGDIRFYNSTKTTTASGTFEFDDNWHHVAVTVSTGGVRIYYDGDLAVYDGTSNAITATAALLYLGRYAPSGIRYFDGSITRVYIHSRALASYEIAQLVAEGPTAQLDVARAGNFRLEETEGLVCRNQIRTQLFSFSDFGDLGSTDAYGDIPSGFSRYTNGLEGDETIVCTCDPDTGLYEINVQNGAGVTSDNIGVQKDVGIVVGRNYVVEVVGRIVSRSASATLQINLAGGVSATLASTIASELTRYTATVTAAGGSSNLFLFVGTTGDVVAEIQSVTITEENAGTPTADMSGLTAPGIVGRGIVLAGSNHVQAPYEAAFDAYPYSFGCAIQHDNTAAGRVPIAICNPAVSDVYWRLQLNPSHEVLIVRRVSGGAEVVTATGVTLDTDPHTLLAVFPDATSAKLYVDGALVYNGTGLTSQAAAANSKAMLIGGYSVLAPAARWVGLVDEASFWERELSDDEAAEHHQFIAFPLAVRNSAEPLGLSASLKL